MLAKKILLVNVHYDVENETACVGHEAVTPTDMLLRWLGQSIGLVLGS